MVEKAKRAKQKVLVTGSRGMLGVELCGELEKEYDIIGLDITKPTAQSPQLKAHIQCDITDKNKTVGFITDAKPDLIIHAAAWTDVDGCEKDPEKAREINEVGTENVAFVASKLDVPIVYISTDFVFDGKKKTPYTESDPTYPLNVYARSKLAGEKIVSKLKKCIIIRASWMFGKYGKNFVDAILTQAKNKKEIRIVDDQVGCPTYTKDLSKAICKLLHKLQTTHYKLHDTYHVTNKGAVSWFDYAKEILKLAEVHDVELAPIKSSELDRAAKRPAYSVLDNSKFEKATGYIMRPWQDALREYICKT